MMVYYQTEPEGDWTLYRCRGSGRTELDSYESNLRCRDLVLQRTAVKAISLDGMTPYACWEWSAAGNQARQLMGPDL